MSVVVEKIKTRKEVISLRHKALRLTVPEQRVRPPEDSYGEGAGHAEREADAQQTAGRGTGSAGSPRHGGQVGD